MNHHPSANRFAIQPIPAQGTGPEGFFRLFSAEALDAAGLHAPEELEALVDLASTSEGGSGTVGFMVVF